MCPFIKVKQNLLVPFKRFHPQSMANIVKSFSANQKEIRGIKSKVRSVTLSLGNLREWKVKENDWFRLRSLIVYCMAALQQYSLLGWFSSWDSVLITIVRHSPFVFAGLESGNVAASLKRSKWMGTDHKGSSIISVTGFVLYSHEVPVGWGKLSWTNCEIVSTSIHFE